MTVALHKLSAYLKGSKTESILLKHPFIKRCSLNAFYSQALLVPAKTGLPVAEYAPNTVKKAVIGVGHGNKEQIKLMVNMLLPKATYDSDDAADGLAIAICHAHHRGPTNARMEAGLRRAS